MSFFYSDIKSEIEIDYNELVLDINKIDNYSLYLISTNYYDIFKTIILSLINDSELILLDYDFSENEINNLLGDKVNLKKKIHLQKPKFNNFSEIISLIKNSNNWRLSLFTSGTTGLPKQIKHTFNSLTRNCKTSNKHHNNIWGYAYNPTHMAGIQVFFQAILNQNSIIRLFNLNQAQIFDSIQKYQITNISATPSFFRLFSFDKTKLDSVRRLTLGGEKFDVNLKDKLKNLFPNSKLLNVYASTEAGSIFASDGEIFTINKNYLNYIKIVDNEIYLHKEILGEGTENKLLRNWYPTGDIVDVIEISPLKFKFSSRKNEMINVGGYKVNPNEIEEILLTIDGVKDVIVFGKQNSVLGNIICTNIAVDKQLEVPTIRAYLSKYLQNYKIPRIITFVDKIEKTRTGKKKR
jgi:acyl-coenzyme A synthetase/AMP-(fatty) acid ligase